MRGGSKRAMERGRVAPFDKFGACFQRRESKKLHYGLREKRVNVKLIVVGRYNQNHLHSDLSSGP